MRLQLGTAPKGDRFMSKHLYAVMAWLVRPSTPCWLKLGRNDVDAGDKHRRDDGE